MIEIAGAETLPFTAGQHVLLVAAHPDDEMLGAAMQLARCGRLSLVHLTDGVPSHRTARAHGFANGPAYGAARARELAAALALAVPSGTACLERFGLGLPDGRASRHMPRAISELAALLDRQAPDIVLTHPYEGGHPDHDTAAFTVRTALRRIGATMPLWEMTSYHAAGGAPVLGDFVPHPGSPVHRIALSSAEQAQKRAILNCFTSQRAVLAPFPVDEERFRPAPDYDFAAPPHPGRLNYENRRRALRGAQWRSLAARAAAADGARRGMIRRVADAVFWHVWLAG